MLKLQKIAEIKEYLNKWKDIPSSWLERLNIVKLSTPQKLTYRFNTMPKKDVGIKIPDFSKKIFEKGKKIFIFIWNCNEP